MCLLRRQDSPSPCHQRCTRGRHPRNSSWNIGDDRYGNYAWWPCMHRDIATETAKCNPCVKIGKKLKSIIPANKWAPLKLCKVPNEEIQIDFGGPISNDKNQ